MIIITAVHYHDLETLYTFSVVLHVHAFLSQLSVTGELQPGFPLPRTPGRGQGRHDAGHLQTQGHRQPLVNTLVLHKTNYFDQSCVGGVERGLCQQFTSCLVSFVRTWILGSIWGCYNY